MLRVLLATVVTLFAPRADLIIENLALRQQLAATQRRSSRPKISQSFPIFWVVLSRIWPKWRQALVLVRPETVVGWHRRGFRAYWKRRSRKTGRPPIRSEIRELILRMARENPTWGAPRIHGETLLLGFNVAERTISRYLGGRPAAPDAVESWKKFLELHREALVGMDFFVVPTITFKRFYVLVFVEHDRRRVLHYAVTQSPTAAWIRQQLREAFPFDAAPSYLILDRDALFKPILSFIQDLRITPKRIGYRKPWQNGICERWIGSVRRELLDYVVVFHESHLRKLLAEYVTYYHEDRPHLALDKTTPGVRDIDLPLDGGAEIVSLPRVGGLHHRYSWQIAA